MGRSFRTAVAKGDREKKPFFAPLLSRFFSSSPLLSRFYCFVFVSCPVMAASAAAAAAGGAGQPGKRKCAAWSSALPLLLLLAVALAGMGTPAAAAEYKVGDSDGWTILKVNYSTWASSKTFHVGDTLVFEYDKNFHNVLEVSQADFGTCGTRSPKVTHNTGKDTVRLNTAGHHYFLCGFPGHCGIGQKVDVNVLASAATPAASPGSTPSSVPPASSPAAGGGSGEAAPPPQKSRAAPGASGSYVVGCAVASLAVAVSLLRLWLG